MTRTRVKVCCMADPDEVQGAVAAGADAVGIVGPMPSGPGTLDDEASARVAASVPLGVLPVLLTAAADGAEAMAHVRRVGADRVGAVQLVRHVPPEAHDEVEGDLPHVRRIQVIHVEDEGAVDVARQYEGRAHALLLDSGRPSADAFGGTGLTHDWGVSRAIVRESAVPVFLAGGLTPENVGEAIRAVRPYGLDLCSGVRTDGALDGKKLDRFMAAVRAEEGVSTR